MPRKKSTIGKRIIKGLREAARAVEGKRTRPLRVTIIARVRRKPVELPGVRSWATYGALVAAVRVVRESDLRALVERCEFLRANLVSVCGEETVAGWLAELEARDG